MAMNSASATSAAIRGLASEAAQHVDQGNPAGEVAVVGEY